MSGAADLEALIERLKNMPPGTTLSAALALLQTPESAGVAEMRRRCALVRGFDAALYAFMAAGLGEAPSLETFVKVAPARALVPGRWALDEAARTPVLREWQSRSLAAWQAWNERLAGYFLERARPAERLDALYHLAATAHPERGVTYFRQWYAEADAEFDLAQCNALLEILRLQEAVRGPALSAQWQQYRQYYQARLFFYDDYYRTGSYFERKGPLEAFQPLLTAGPLPWIFHLHATGGSGKTMFLRWLVVRYLVPKRIPCARIDFDDFKLSDVLEYPSREIFARVIDQWARQVPGAGLTDLRVSLSKELQSPGWNTSIPALMGSQLRGAQLDTPLVVILDTLEDVTRTAQSWLQQCVAALRQLHSLCPSVILILSGRYDISELTDALIPGEFVNYALPRFTRSEAHGYLQSRGVPEGALRDAIVERVGGRADLAESDELADGNPFKLGMLAELTLKNPAVTPQEILGYKRIDVAYLVYRIVRRVASQPLRWAIRYGVVARHLNKEFIDAVLLPPLRAALSGEAEDVPNANLQDEFHDSWVPEPDLAGAISADDIWTQLKSYARYQGWISLVEIDTGDGLEELHFHPEVILPMRDLLRPQPIFNQLQQRALQFFTARGAAQIIAQLPTEQRAARAVSTAREAIFHRFQLEGPKAYDAWLENLSALERFGPAEAAQYAIEITGKDYATEQVEPLQNVSSAKVLCEAHWRAADLLLQAAGLSFAAGNAYFADFQRRFEWANSIAVRHGLQSVPQYLRVIHDSVRQKAERAITLLTQGIAKTADPRERALLTMVLAKRLHRYRPEDALPLYDQLILLLPKVSRTGLRAVDVALTEALLLEELGRYERCLALYDAAQSLAGEDRKLLALVYFRRASYALAVGEIQEATRYSGELEALPAQAQPRQNSLQLLKTRLALLRSDALTATALAMTGQPMRALERAQLQDQAGVAAAGLLSFNAAFALWESAAADYDRARSPTGATRCTLLAAKLKALGCGNIYEATSILESATRAKNLRDAELYAEFRLLRAYTLYRLDQKAEARGVLDELRRSHAPWTTTVRARVLLFGFLFNLATCDDRYLAVLVESVEAIQPANARAALLEWCEFSEERLSVSTEMCARLTQVFGLSGDNDLTPLQYDLNRAQFLKMLHGPQWAVEYLLKVRDKVERETEPARFQQRWLLQLTLQKLGQPTEFRAVLEVARKVLNADSVLRVALQVEAAWEAWWHADREQAAQLLPDATSLEPLRSEGKTWWLNRIEEVRTVLETGASPGSFLSRKAAFYDEIGDLVEAGRLRQQSASLSAQDLPVIASAARLPTGATLEASGLPPAQAPPGASIIVLRTRDLPEPLLMAAQDNEVCVDRLLGAWPMLAREMSDCLYSRDIPLGSPELQLDLDLDLASLPWELAAALLPGSPRVWRLVRSAQRSAGQGSGLRVLLIQPADSARGGGISLESTSGSSLESLYRDAAELERLDVSYNPSPEELHDTLLKCQPNIIHVNAAVRELQGGTYLDFESTEQLADMLGSGPHASTFPPVRGATTTWTARRLGLELASLKQAPTLILDTPGSHNLADTARMLLLRNSYAAQIVHFFPFRSLLATGLAPDHQREELTLAWMTRLFSGGPFAALQALRSTALAASQDLSAALATHTAALWTTGADEGSSLT